jgi:hypothetical protein
MASGDLNIITLVERKLAARFRRSVTPNVRWRSARRRSSEKSAKQVRREVDLDAGRISLPR